MNKSELVDLGAYACLYEEASYVEVVIEGAAQVHRLRHPKRGNILAFQHGIADAVLIVPGWEVADLRGVRSSAQIVPFR